MHLPPLGLRGLSRVNITLCDIQLDIRRTVYMSSSLSYCRTFNFNWDKPAATRRVCRVQQATGRLQALFSWRYRLSGLWWPCARQLSQEVPADAGFPYDKVAIVSDRIKGTYCPKPAFYERRRKARQRLSKDSLPADLPNIEQCQLILYDVSLRLRVLGG